MAKKKKKSEEFHTSWLDTYADTITLLMTFFVLLYSMSSIDSSKIKQLSKEFNKVFSGETADSILEYNLYNGDVPLVGGESKDDIDSIENEGDRQTYAEVKAYIEEKGLTDSIKITTDENGGTILQLKDNILFDIGKADLKDDSIEILDKIAALLSTLPNNIIVEGHTDNVPIKTDKFDSNWELSTGRAGSVVRYFTEKKGLAPGKFSAAGKADTKPVKPNTSDENRSENRRVNIVIQAKGKE